LPGGNVNTISAIFYQEIKGKLEEKEKATLEVEAHHPRWMNLTSCPHK